MVDIAFHLAGLAESEIEDYFPDGLREAGDALRLRLHEVAAMLTKLLADGWSARIVRNSLVCQHPEVTTIQYAVERMQRLGIDPEEVTDIAEWDEDGRRVSPS